MPVFQATKLSNKTIAYLWSEIYLGTGDKKKMSRAFDVLEAKKRSIPWKPQRAIIHAQRIHGNDMGVRASVLKQLVEATGWIETAYLVRKQRGGGPALSFWQIEPETAVDLFTNSRKLFGMRWHSHFGYGKRMIKRKSIVEISSKLVSDDDLGASLCAVKWIASGHNAIKWAIKETEK